MAPNTDDFNKDELEAPEWLNAQFLTEVLKNADKNNDVKVKNFQITPASQKGDHYASIMFRVSVDYSAQDNERSKSLIIKTMPENESLKKDLIGESKIFETEIGMYTKIIPKFEQILRESGDDTVLGAPCLYYSLSPKKLIVFEDIVPRGYTVLRSRQANIEEVRFAYLKLAKWHAVSYKLLQEDPNVFSEFRHSLFTMDLVENEFMTGGLSKFLGLLDTIPDLKEFKAHFAAIEKLDYFEKCKTSFKEYNENKQADAHYVLCHGDFHVKNMMFKNNTKNNALEDIMLLDFQLSYVGPMVNDIIYSFFMLLDDDLRTNHKDELIYYYFTKFLETLDQIKYAGKKPKYIEFREMLMRHKHFELFLLYTFLPMWYAFKEGQVDPNDLLESDDMRKGLYYNQKFIDELHIMLPRYLHLGYFEN